MRGETGSTGDMTYKAFSRSGHGAFQEVGGAHSTADRKDNRTLQEGRGPTLVTLACGGKCEGMAL